ncbi:membrane-associated proteins in eicosanoid and glutathione metabolism [Rhizopogon vinicolor AM-OR11-026]|uniref:Membrane-associated proteins in eicosanoid and glutathione metabolism n=1 Tax=Rhizopogon vinicolor AM-OR11-026 TaxID=1314800 RepID=A0A1B7NI61_9AGAM|nr:membrane-associated proteins in eicosanoid and glutathione metabolism [Rhizopogon vinicolor AM-OR11-026]
MSLPVGYGYIPASLMSIGWVLMWQTFMVGRYRKRAGINYPQMYAEKAEVEASEAALRFNCMQRAHQNTLESVPLVFLSTVVAGLKYPVLAAALCATYSTARVIYTVGYKTGQPKRRTFGNLFGSVSALGLFGSATYAAYQLFPGC